MQANGKFLFTLDAAERRSCTAWDGDVPSGAASARIVFELVLQAGPDLALHAAAQWLGQRARTLRQAGVYEPEGSRVPIRRSAGPRGAQAFPVDDCPRAARAADLAAPDDHRPKPVASGAMGRWPYWPAYFTAIDRLLAPGGRGGLQAITMPHDRMLATCGGHSWITSTSSRAGRSPPCRRSPTPCASTPACA